VPGPYGVVCRQAHNCDGLYNTAARIKDLGQL
jgi:hypothetical protein